MTKLTPRRGIDIYPAPQSQKVRIGLRYAREGELEDFLTAQVRTTRAIDDAARKADIACEQAVPPDLGDWRATIEFVLGPYFCAKDLAQVSSFDFARARRAQCGGFLQAGIWRTDRRARPGPQYSPGDAGNDDRHQDAASPWKPPRARSAARAAIVTVPTNVVASGGLKFSPELRPS